MGLCPDTPKTPDYEEAAKQGVYADLETYPLRYLVDAASRSGGNVTVDGTNYDFTGLGAVDNARVMSDKMAQTLLDIQKDLGPEFIKQRIEELKLADPQGYAARKQLFDQIVASAQENPDRPIAEGLQSSIVSELQNAGRLDARQLQEVRNAARGQQVARGNYLGNAAIADEAKAVVGASEASRTRQQEQALAFLNSGTTPEDIEYRRMQQSMGNLLNFANGTTPTAQFRGVSAAGVGAVPFTSGGASNVVTNPGAGAQGAQNALNIYNGKMNWAANQANPWLAGLSTGVSTFGALTAARPAPTA
jgi:hypothetical protein